MNSVKSYSNHSPISVPLIRENLKRFWLGSLLAFIGYFIMSCVPILMMRDAESVDQMLSGVYIPAALWAAGIPVVAAMLIYHYLHYPGSAAVVHSLPLSRKQLFHSNFLSGAILCLAPVLLTGVILLLIRAAGGSITIVESFDPAQGLIYHDAFTYGAIFRFVAALSVVTLVVYAIAILAAVLVGTALMQALFSGLLLFLFAGLVVILSDYADMYLFGYETPELVGKLMQYLCPVAGLMLDRSAVCLIGYLIALLPVATWYKEGQTEPTQSS